MQIEQFQEWQISVGEQLAKLRLFSSAVNSRKLETTHKIRYCHTWTQRNSDEVHGQWRSKSWWHTSGPGWYWPKKRVDNTSTTFLQGTASVFYFLFYFNLVRVRLRRDFACTNLPSLRLTAADLFPPFTSWWCCTWQIEGALDFCLITCSNSNEEIKFDR